MLFHYREPPFFLKGILCRMYEELLVNANLPFPSEGAREGEAAAAGEPRRIKEMRLRLNPADYNLRAQKPTLWEGTAAFSVNSAPSCPLCRGRCVAAV